MSIPLGASLLATHNYYHPRLLLCLLGSTSSDSCCGSTEYPGQAISPSPVSPKPTRGTGGRAAFSGIPCSCLGPRSWRPQSTRISPGLQHMITVTRPVKPRGSSLEASLAKPTPGRVPRGHGQPRASGGAGLVRALHSLRPHRRLGGLQQ
ncbi:pancreatic progenitor cell differentiation and proliferation factor-like [Equus quagga]|uniref:pancreatic progenitor cell differentiation and proliferation factor-like n=1 Tax=Equus quagga TaxID=89248 RepID=UPI001EE22759|nr:pancreatic progenitor cell differentiation and proliferation factor-like [Equus quagga]